MIECIFTLDYEIYGNGRGSLRELVLDPTERLAEIFREVDAPFVVFAEAVEFAKMEEAQSDPDIAEVSTQLRALRAAGHEIALHIHPWWANARYENSQWHLDWSEQNICVLKPERVDAIISGAIAYLRKALKDSTFTPHSFRSGLWLMQPTDVIGKVLSRHGIRIDSSVFKGGMVKGLNLDYRVVASSSSSWKFSRDVVVPDSEGMLQEIPIYTQMVPFWRMLGRKRLTLQSRTRTASQGSPLPRQLSDFLRFRYPRKLDFCRMTFKEMRKSFSEALKQHRRNGLQHSSVVAIGHSKDFVDADALRSFLEFLRERSVPVTTFSRGVREEAQLFS